MNSMEGVQNVCWSDLPEETVFPGVRRQRLDTQRMSVVRYQYDPGTHFPAHSHPEEQLVLVLSGEIEFTVEDRQMPVAAGGALVIPPQMIHSARVLSTTQVDTINVLSPRRISEITLTS